ncbi:hypothetical protein [Pumilibacter muris]|uniref:hypothetical protein n=1 Tax=Pumilibacter muris TaxID=2941510 RepID=UPI002040A061|nr:hypothetical protein [Pumilibacter muris]
MDMWDLVNDLQLEVAELQETQEVFVEDLGQLLVSENVSKDTQKRLALLCFIGNAMANRLGGLCKRISDFWGIDSKLSE